MVLSRICDDDDHCTYQQPDLGYLRVQLEGKYMYFDFVFVSLSSICDKATAYNCIGRVYCLHSVCVCQKEQYPVMMSAK